MLGKHSGRAALAHRAKALGYHLTGEQLLGVFEEFKQLADKKKEVYDGDIVALVQQQLQVVAQGEWQLVSYEVHSSSDQAHRVRLTLQCGDELKTAESSEGDGPVDAAFWATEEITGLKMVCQDFQLRSATIGRDAQGEATVEVDHLGMTFRGRGVSTDTMEATIKAILNVVNRVILSKTVVANTPEVVEP